MGRHSRPEDLEDEDQFAGTAVDTAASTGRHAGATVVDPDAAAGGVPDAVPDAVPHTPAGAVPDAVPDAAPDALPDAVAGAARSRPRPRPATNPLRGTAADLKLLRDHSDVRHRCIAAAVVPFLVFTLALVATGHVDKYLVWIFLPTIVAGVLVGVILDHAHKRYPEG